MVGWRGRWLRCLLGFLPFVVPADALAQSASGFDAAGVTTIRIGSHPADEVSDAIRLASGAMLLGGTLGSGDSSQAFVARLLPDGRVDPGFGTGGVTTLPAPSTGAAVAVHPAGGMVLAGTMGPFGGRVVMVARFSDAGVLDAGYGDGGIATASVPDLSSVNDVAMSGAGLAFASGSLTDPFRAIVVRFDAAGNLDSPYGTDGVAIAGDETLGNGIAVTNAGVAFVAGTTGPFADRDLTVFCFTTTGTLSAVYGGGTGMATSTLGATRSLGRDIVLDGAGRAVVVGYTQDPTEAAVARFTVAGAADATFGGGLGYRMLGFTGTSQFSAIAIDGSNRILAAGQQAANLLSGTPRVAGLARLTAAGALDASFGIGGRVTEGLLGNDNVVGLGVDDASDRIVLAGRTSPPHGRSSAVTLAITDDGDVDATYGTSGSVLAPLSSIVDSPADGMALQPDGRIVVTGSATFADGRRPYVARLNADGTLDPTFSADGVVTLPTSLVVDAGEIALHADGRIVVAMQPPGSLVADVLVRLDANGGLDTAFGAGGLASIPHLPAPIYEALAPLADGSTLAAGAHNGAPGGVVVARFTPQGTPDPTFGPPPGGVAAIPVAGFDWGYAAHVLPDGRLLVPAHLDIGSDPTPGLVRLTAAGESDPTFHGDGIATVAVEGRALALLSAGDDGLLVGGEVFAPARGVFLARFDHDGVADPGFGTGGVVTDATAAPTESVAGLAMDAAGCIVAGGVTGSEAATRLVALARYLPDGSPDPTFGTGGGMLRPVGPAPSTSEIRLDAGGNAFLVGSIASGPDRIGLVARFPAGCNDGDGCTTDRCAPGAGCTHTQLTGVAGARCLCGVTPPACAGVTPPASVSRKADKACSLLSAADATEGKKRKRTLAKARRLLQQARKNAARAGRGKKPKIARTCADALGASFTEQRARAVEAMRGT